MRLSEQIFGEIGKVRPAAVDYISYYKYIRQIAAEQVQHDVDTAAGFSRSAVGRNLHEVDFHRDGDVFFFIRSPIKTTDPSFKIPKSKSFFPDAVEFL